MSPQPPLTIAVLGATGVQGRGVLRALLSHPLLTTYHIRALTRTPSSPTAQALLTTLQTPDQRLSLAAADVYDMYNTSPLSSHITIQPSNSPTPAPPSPKPSPTPTASSS